MQCERLGVPHISRCGINNLDNSRGPLMPMANVFKMFGREILARRDCFGVLALSTT